MAALLTSLGEVATKVLTFVASVCSTITSEPLLLLTVGFLFIGGVIGIFGRLLSRGQDMILKGGLLTETPSAMSALLTQLGTVATAVLDTVADVAGVIVAQPLLLLTVGFLFIGGVIGIFGRLLSRS